MTAEITIHAISVTKSLNAVVVLVDALGVRFNPISEKYVSLFFDNADSNYAEVCFLVCLVFNQLENFHRFVTL